MLIKVALVVYARPLLVSCGSATKSKLHGSELVQVEVVSHGERPHG